MTKTPSKKRRLLLWIGIPLLLIIIAAVVVVSLGVNTFLKPTIKRTLAKIVVDGSDSLYTFSLGDYTVGPGGRSVTFSKLNIVVDSNRYFKLRDGNKLPPLIFSIKIDAVAITGLHPWDLWRNKNIICDEIAMANSVIIIQQQQQIRGTVKTAEPKTIYQLIKPDINNIDIGKINISNSDLTFKTLQQQTQKRDFWHFEKIQIKLTDILIDSLTHADTSRILYASNLQTSFDNLNMKSSNGLYQYAVGKTAYDFKKRSVDITDIKMLPAVTQEEFNQRMGHAKDRFTVSASSLEVVNFNASALLIDDKIEARTINIKSPVINIYKDKTIPLDSTSKLGTYPHQQLLKADGLIDLDIIKISNGSLTFTEKNPRTLMEGSFVFTNINGNVTNVTNQPAKIAVNNWCKANLKASFMGNNDMDALFSFDLGSTNGHFMVDANLKSLQASQINPAMKALARAEFESFNLDDLKYHIEGDDYKGVGDLRMRYSNMKVNVLKLDNDGNFKKKGLISALANLIKLYPDNPMSGEPERIVKNVITPRIISKNFFVLLCFTLLECTQEITVKGKNKSLPGMTKKSSPK